MCRLAGEGDFWQWGGWQYWGRVSTGDGWFGERLYVGAEMGPRICEGNGGGGWRLGFGGVPVGEGPVADFGEGYAGRQALGALESLAVVEVGYQFAFAVVEAAVQGEDA